MSTGMLQMLSAKEAKHAIIIDCHKRLALLDILHHLGIQRPPHAQLELLLPPNQIE
jgi:hypothetical protein